MCAHGWVALMCESEPPGRFDNLLITFNILSLSSLLQSPMQRLYRHVFPALLQLACDVEQVARQLFEPLVMQLIHWFTGNKKFESEETVTFLNAMLEGVVHPTHTALRDFSARCLKEFLKWSIKQTSKKVVYDFKDVHILPWSFATTYWKESVFEQLIRAKCKILLLAHDGLNI